MPAAYINNRQQQEGRREVEESLRSDVVIMHRDAHRADSSRSVSNKIYQELRQIENRHRKFMDATTGTRARCYLFVVVIVAVYFLDVMLFGGAANLLAKKSFPNNLIMYYAFKFAIPAVILAIELWLAILIYGKFTEEDEPLQRKTKINLWFLAGVVFALVMPLFIVASDPDILRYLNGGSNLETVLQFRLLGLFILAFIAHTLTIFTGKYSYEAKSLLLFRYDHRKLIRRVTDSDEDFETFAQSTVNHFNSYYAERQTFNGRYPQNQVPVAEFDVVARELINERFGREVIQTPIPANNANNRQEFSNNQHSTNGTNGSSSNGHQPSAVPPAEETSSDNGSSYSPQSAQNPAETPESDESVNTETENENEYLRQTLSRRVRDADDEL